MFLFYGAYHISHYLFLIYASITMYFHQGDEEILIIAISIPKSSVLLLIIMTENLYLFSEL